MPDGVSTLAGELHRKVGSILSSPGLRIARDPLEVLPPGVFGKWGSRPRILKPAFSSLSFARTIHDQYDRNLDGPLGVQPA